MKRTFEDALRVATASEAKLLTSIAVGLSSVRVFVRSLGSERTNGNATMIATAVSMVNEGRLHNMVSGLSSVGKAVRMGELWLELWFVGTVLREIAGTGIRISSGAINRVNANFLVLLKIRGNSARGRTSTLTTGVTNLEVFASRGSGVGLTLTSMGNSILMVSGFALYTSYSRNEHPGFVTTTEPSATSPLCRCFYGGVRSGKVRHIRGKVFNTSVGISLMGSNPIAVRVGAGSLGV